MYLGVGFGSVAGSGPPAVVTPSTGVFDFLTSQMDNRLTLTRPSPANYFNSSGVLVEADINTPRFGYYWTGTAWVIGGLLLDSQERTNRVLHNRDLTNAAWIKADVTASKNSTGLDAIANSASRITATAANGTCLQTITNAAATWTFSAYITRLAGTGKIDITLDGGALWIDVTRFIDNTRPMRVCQTLQNITNPTVGYRIRTSGDAIAIDAAQLEIGSGPSSPILTEGTAVTRSPDVVVCEEHRFGWYSQAGGTMLLEWLFPDFQRGTCGLVSVDDGTPDNRIYFNPLEAENNREQTLYSVVGGVQEARMHSKIPRWGHVQTAAYRYSAADFFLSIDGLVADSTNDSGTGLVPTVARMDVGFGEFSGFVRRIENRPTLYTNDETCGLITRALPQRQLNTFALGACLSGLEFGATMPGTVGTTYFVPTEPDINYYGLGEGFDHFRLAFRWERLQPTLGAALNAAYLGYITSTVALAAAAGMTSILDMHNFGGYTSGGVNRKINSVGGPTTANLVDCWVRIAAVFDSNPDVLGYDIQNEPSLGTGIARDWYNCAQAVVTGLRNAGSTKPIFIEGHGSSAATQWTDNDIGLNTDIDLFIIDPLDNMVFSAHGYFDGNNSGAYAGTYDAEGATPHTGIVRFAPFLAWCGIRKRTAHIGEFNAPGRPIDDDRWLATIENAMDELVAHGVPGSVWGGGNAWSPNYPLRLSPVGGVEQRSVSDVYENYISADLEAPSKVPNALATSTGVKTASVTWGAATDNVGVVSYRVRRGGVVVATVSASTLSYADSGLSPITLYSYTIAAVDAGGNEGPESDAALVTTDADVIAPTAPVLTATAAGSTAIQLAWTASTDNHFVALYTIFRDTVELDTVAGTVLAFLNDGLSDGATHTYSVIASDPTGNESAPSNDAVASTPSLVPAATFDFMTTLDPRVTLTRAGTAYYFDASGVLQSAGTNVPRFGYYHNGVAWVAGGLLLDGQSRTNRVLHNRDLTNAVWVKTNGSALKNVTGIDGVSNSASRFTATGANATCLQSITSASALRAHACFLKRLTGTGPIDITLDGGTTWYKITRFVDDTNWTRVYWSTTLANPVVGIRVRTSGDAVGYDFGQEETGGGPSSPIPTTTVAVTRAPDVLTVTGTNFSSWYTQGQGTLLTEHVITAYNTSLMSVADINSGSSSNRLCIQGAFASSLLATVNVGDIKQAQLDLNQLASDIVTRAALAYGPSYYHGACNGFRVSESPQLTGTVPAGLTRMVIGGPDAFHGFIRRIQYYTGGLGGDDLETITAPDALPKQINVEGLRLGINLSGMEFAGVSFPVHQDDVNYYSGKGFPHFRLPFNWERLQPVLGGALDSTYLGHIIAAMDKADAAGMKVLLDLHNYGSYNSGAGKKGIGAVGGPTRAQYADVWARIATATKDHPALLGYDLMNEPGSGAGTPVTIYGHYQACIDAIRPIDAVTPIYVMGATSAGGTGQWIKTGNNPNMDVYLDDPSDLLVYHAHSYWDDDHSGTFNESYAGEHGHPQIGVKFLQPFLAWCLHKRVRGHIGEFAVPGLTTSDPRWLVVMENAMDELERWGVELSAWGGGRYWSNSYYGKLSPINGVEAPIVTQVYVNYL